MPVTLALKLTWILNICCFPMFSSHAIKMILQLPWFSAFHLWTTATKYIHSQINMNDEKASGRGAVTIHLWVHLKYNYIDGETSSVLLRPLKRHLITHCACNTTVTLDRLWRFVCVYVCVFSWMCAKRASLREPVLYSSAPTSAPEHLERECGRLQKAVVVWGQR